MLRRLFTGFLRGLGSIVAGVVIGSVVSEIVRREGIGAISKWVVEFMELYGLDVKYIVFSVIFTVSYVLFLASVSSLSVWIILRAGKLIQRMFPSTQLREMSWSIRVLCYRIEPFPIGHHDPELVELSDIVWSELERICGFSRLPEVYWLDFFKMIHRPVQLGDIERVREIHARLKSGSFHGAANSI